MDAKGSSHRRPS